MKTIFPCLFTPTDHSALSSGADDLHTVWFPTLWNHYSRVNQCDSLSETNFVSLNAGIAKC